MLFTQGQPYEMDTHQRFCTFFNIPIYSFFSRLERTVQGMQATCQFFFLLLCTRSRSARFILGYHASQTCLLFNCFLFLIIIFLWWFNETDGSTRSWTSGFMLRPFCMLFEIFYTSISNTKRLAATFTESTVYIFLILL